MPLLRKDRLSILLVITASTLWVGVALSQNNISHNPTWWDKYQYIVHNGPTDGGGATTSVSIGGTIDVSTEGARRGFKRNLPPANAWLFFVRRRSQLGRCGFALTTGNWG